MTRSAHAFFAIAITVVTWRTLSQPWIAELGDLAVYGAVSFALLFMVAAGSGLSLLAGWLGRDDARAFRLDVLSALAAYAGVFVLALAPGSRDVVGLVVMLIVATRLAPAAWWAVRFGAPPLFSFALAFACYAPLAAWRVAASLPLGDQVFYLLSADGISRGSLDATIDAVRFTALLGIAPQLVDSATHVALMPAGARLVQGYALPLLLAPGWIVAGQLGATLVIALFAAWASYQTWLLLSETVPDERAARVTWALVTFLAPLALVAVHVYPNAVGAAVIATAYRYGFTARHRRAAVAGALLGATAFLNPRDGLAIAALLPFAVAWPRSDRVRLVAGAAAVVLAAAVFSLVTTGIPVPYAGYLYGTAAAQGLDPEPTWTFRFWIGLPAILFDRVFGAAGTAPWLFLAALGAAPALRTARARLLPGACAVAASLVLLSLFRLWEGGYAPSNRYLVDVLPLAAPFIAFGLAAARGPLLRAFALVTIATGALATLFLLAVPSAALNTAFDDKPQALLIAALGLDPVGWLPSFQPVTPDWWIGAYLRLVPAVAIVAFLVWRGRRAAA